MVLDPPKFARSRRALDDALRAYHWLNRLAVELLDPGGILVTCSCSGHVSREDFRMMLLGVAQQTGRDIQILQEARGGARSSRGRHLPGGRLLEVFRLPPREIARELVRGVGHFDRSVHGRLRGRRGRRRQSRQSHPRAHLPTRLPFRTVPVYDALCSAGWPGRGCRAAWPATTAWRRSACSVSSAARCSGTPAAATPAAAAAIPTARTHALDPLAGHQHGRLGRRRELGLAARLDLDALRGDRAGGGDDDDARHPLRRTARAAMGTLGRNGRRRRAAADRLQPLVSYSTARPAPPSNTFSARANCRCRC